jgi:hypothetical protein
VTALLGFEKKGMSCVVDRPHNGRPGGPFDLSPKDATIMGNLAAMPCVELLRLLASKSS